MTGTATATPQPLLKDIRSLIDSARTRVVARVNAEITALYWQVGRRLHSEVMQGQRAEYGKQLVAELAQALMGQYGRGWSEPHLRQCLQLAQAFDDEKILYTVCTELSWSHIRALMYINEPLKREFYITLCKHERWSVRTLQDRIKSMLYERTAISKKPELTIRNDLQSLRDAGKLSADLAFRDPYVLDFLGLHDDWSEQDLESAIVSDLQKFIIELGSDFAFMARQKRLTIDGRDYKIDLLFYHRRLKSLVAIDLKLGEFEAAYKGQMELYLRWLEKHEQVEGENAPIGLILCAGKNTEHVELLQLDKSNIRVAQYLTLLPAPEVFANKLHHAMALAQARLHGDGGGSE